MVTTYTTYASFEEIAAPTAASDHGVVYVKADGNLYFASAGGSGGTVSETKVNSQTAAAIAADDITTGDAAVTIDTSSGDVLIDSQAGATTVDGHTGVTIQSSNSGDITLDSVADIVIDAAGGNIEFKDAGTTQLLIDMDTTSAEIRVELEVDGDDLVFYQFDGTEVLRLTDGADVEVKDNLSLKSDAAVLKFGASEEITLTHEADVGLILTHTGTGDNLPIILTLKSEEDAIISGVVIGAIDFKGGDSGGTDAILVCAGIEAVATDTHAADNNATKLSFKTAATEVAAEKMSLSSAGLLTVSGRIITDDATEATSATDGSLQTDGGLSVVKDCVFGDDVFLLSDSAVLNMGAGNDVTFTHDGTSGLTIAATPISINSTGDLTLDSSTDIVLDAAGVNFEFKDAGTTQLTIDVDTTAGDIDINLNVEGDDLVFNQQDGTEVLRLTDGALVGINSATPTARLAVDGDMHRSSSTSAKQ